MRSNGPPHEMSGAAAGAARDGLRPVEIAQDATRTPQRCEVGRTEPNPFELGVNGCCSARM